MRYFSKLVSRFERKERVVVVHLLRDGLHIQRCAVSQKRGTATCAPFPVYATRIASLPVALKEVRRAAGGLWHLLRSQFVFMLDPGFASSVYGANAVPREHPKESIHDADVENIIAQALWKMFDRERTRAAGKMGFSEVDLVLSDVRVNEIRLDEHRVVDPRGFTARTVGINLLMTILPRTLLDAFYSFFPKTRKVFFGEGGIINAHAFSLKSEKEGYIFVQVFSAVSDVFVVKQHTMVHADTIPWGARDITRAIAHAFSVSADIAHEIIRRVVTKEASPHFIRHAEKVIAIAYEDFAKRLGKTIQHHASAQVVVMPFSVFSNHAQTPDAFPQTLFSGQFRTRSGTKVRFKPAPYHASVELLHRFERGASHIDSAWDFSTYAAIAHFFFSASDDTLNKVARRHARWLSDSLQQKSETHLV